MTPQFILRASLNRAPHCSNRPTTLSDIEDVQWAEAYAEPGYDQPRKGILYADWNYFSREVADLLERYGYSIEWEDEWATCDECYKLVRTSPNSFSWEPYYIENKCEFICKSCAKDDD